MAPFVIDLNLHIPSFRIPASFLVVCSLVFFFDDTYLALDVRLGFFRVCTVPLVARLPEKNKRDEGVERIRRGRGKRKGAESWGRGGRRRCLLGSVGGIVRTLALLH